MKIGIVSDIHGNDAALARAFDLMSDVDELVCLGDSINQFRFSNEVVQRLKDRCAHVILGNHEEIFMGRGSERARAHAWIDRDLMDWLAKQPIRVEFERCGKNILLVHSTPWPSGSAYVTPQSPNFSKFGDTSSDIVMYGHTHQKVAVRVGGTLVINPGSTGEAYAGQNDLHMSCAVLDVVSEDVRHIDFKV